MIDAQPGDDGWIVPLAVTTALFDDPEAAETAYRVVKPLAERAQPQPAPHNPLWIDAARHGLTDPELHEAAVACFQTALGGPAPARRHPRDHGRRQGVPGPLRHPRAAAPPTTCSNACAMRNCPVPASPGRGHPHRPREGPPHMTDPALDTDTDTDTAVDAEAFRERALTHLSPPGTARHC